MAKITWDAPGEHFYETGVDHAVLYPVNTTARTESDTDATYHIYEGGVAWNGMTGVTESPEGGDPEDLWADNIKYLALPSAESYGMTITAYTYPDEFMACDGSASLATGITIGQQARQSFGFSYRTIKGNDVKLNDYGNLIHLVYGCTCSPSDRDYSTVNDSPEAIEFSWDVKATPIPVTNKQATATLVIDTAAVRKAYGEKGDAVIAAIEAALYGTESSAAYLPTPDQLLALITTAAT